MSALNAAKATLEKADATQSAVNAALAALTAARNGLADEAPAAKTPEASVTIPVTEAPEVKEVVAAGGGTVTVVESTVSAEAVAQIVDNASTVASAAKAKAAEKIASGEIAANETVVAEVKIVTALPQNLSASEVKETVTNVSAAAIRAIVEESAKAENANVELVLTVESGLASVTLDGTALTALVAGGAETVSVTVVADARNAVETILTNAQANAVPADKVPFAIEIAADNAPVTTLASEIAVTVPHAAPAANKKFVVCHVASDGSKTKIDATYADGKLTFVTNKI